MKLAHNGSNKTLAAFPHRAKALVALAMFLIFFVSLPVPSSMANIIDKNQSRMEAVLKEAHADIAQSQPDPAKVRQAISLLEGYKSQLITAWPIPAPTYPRSITSTRKPGSMRSRPWPWIPTGPRPITGMGCIF
jgi:hypothetical protein